MKIHPMLVFVVVLIAAAATIIIAARRCSGASDRAAAAGMALADLRAQAQEILQLRGLRERIAERKKPEQDLIARVHAVLQQANIPIPEHFQSLRPDSDAALSDRKGYRRQSVRVAFDRLTIPQAGAFLTSWRSSQPLWTISRIELQHSRDPAHADRYDLSLTLSAIYLDPDGSSS